MRRIPVQTQLLEDLDSRPIFSEGALWFHRLQEATTDVVGVSLFDAERRRRERQGVEQSQCLSASLLLQAA